MDSESYEDRHVHQVYEVIASHFSSTRYKPWPIVRQFLTNLPDGSVGLDVGCGNGKYLAVNPRIFIVASDRSQNLVEIASQHEPHSVVVADNLALPHPHASFDFVLSIAVVHHLSTPSRRVEAISSLLELLRPPSLNDSMRSSAVGGKVLIFVWALEQKSSRRGWDEGDQQDVMVPWVTKQQGRNNGTADEKTYHRYYHLYSRGELERNVVQAGGVVVASGYEKDNWWTIAARSS